MRRSAVAWRVTPLMVVGVALLVGRAAGESMSTRGPAGTGGAYLLDVAPNTIGLRYRMRVNACADNVGKKTLMLMVIDSMTNHPYFDAYAVRLIRHATEAFLRLSVFPPFQAVREPFRCHIGADFLTRRREDQVLVTCPSEEDVMQATDDMIEALQIMGKVGLAGPKLGDQVKVVNWYREKVLPRERKALLRKCSAALSAPVTIDPHEPLWRALKRLRHP